MSPMRQVVTAAAHSRDKEKYFYISFAIRVKSGDRKEVLRFVHVVLVRLLRFGFATIFYGSLIVLCLVFL